MTRSTYGGSSNSPWATGQENYDFSVLFDDHSISNLSHNFTVSENFVRVAAFNLAAGDVLTIQQVTGQGAGTNFADYCPVLGPATLYYNSATDQRTSLVLERPGTYRVRLDGEGLGTVRCFAIRFYMENESNSDLTDALTTLIEHLDPDPCDLGALIAAPGVQPNTGRVVILNDDGCMREAQLVSDDVGNTTVLHSNGVYTPITTPCDMGAAIDQGGLQPSTNTIVAVDTTGPDPSNCLIEMQLVSDDVGNLIELRPDGVYASGATDPCAFGNVVPHEENAVNNVLALDNDNCVVDQQLVSSLAGNLIQLQLDGVYFGTNAGQFGSQYVSSSTGNDANDGLSPSSPLQTINFALSRIPNATAGNIYLKAGDVFHTYPTAVTDVINTLTVAQSQTAIMDVQDRMIAFIPYGDTPIDEIANYNAVNGTGYDPYVAAETNFPEIHITLSNPTNSPGNYIPLGFTIGLNGSIATYATNIVVGQTGTVSPVYEKGAINGGTLTVQGGHLIVGNVPLVGATGFVGTQNVNLFLTLCEDHGTPSTPPLFCAVGPQFFINTQPASPGGGLIVPSLAWTYIADTAETFLTPVAMWPGITIYSTPNRAFKKVITSIAIA